ncbi:hypothetical protein [Rubinisphaera sp. JC750]|uniref:hypothetical protein n=1 Tax=Rubinisphaera sp. JC750 TaxID=2898658 RepID=UPI001F400545|nr:hypothetical protein [Rubinisphaera sp. JC750]
MKNVSIFRAARPRRGLISSAMVCLLFSGCMGQKHSLPSFSWKQSSETSEKVEAAAEKTTPVAAEKDLMHVALNDPAAMGQEPSLGQSDILQASGEMSADGSKTTLAGGEDVNWDDIDAAFQSPSEAAPEEAPLDVDDNLEEFEGVIASVDEGQSHLDALKQSLDELNQQEAARAGSVYLGNVSEATWGNTAQASAEQPALGKTELVNHETQQVEPFPTDLGSATGNASEEGPLEKARLLVEKSRNLIQQNNLRAATAVAQSAQAMLQRTQTALTPGEVTPEQVLADIAARQAAHEQRLAKQQAMTQSQQVANTGTARNTEPQQPIPVRIDLSRDWVNTDADLKNEGQDELKAFAQATVQANRPASLPVISPGSEFVPNSDPMHVSEAESDVLQAPAVEDTLATPADISDVVRLGDLPADSSAAPFVLSGDSKVDDEAPTYEASSAPPLHLGNADPAPSLGGGSAPMLIAPGGMAPSLDDDAAEIDEFAADFANVTQDAPPTLDEAPLLIDEAELRDEPQKEKGMSRMNMLLIAGGIVAGVLLFSRWKR